jgi:hypothetical protein
MASAWELGGRGIGDWTTPDAVERRPGAVRQPALFVDGADGPPAVATRVVPLEDWFGDGRGFYQVIVEIGGVRVVDRLSPGAGRRRGGATRRTR